MSTPGELIVDRLVKHAASYFSTIRARKSAPDLDPFLASLMEDAIRAKAGLPPREPAPAPAANGANGIPQGVPGVLAVMKAGDPEGMLYSEIKRAGFTSKTTVTRGLAKLIAAGVVLPKNKRGRYQLTGKEPDSALDGRSAPMPAPTSDREAAHAIAILREAGLRAPGGIQAKIVEFAQRQTGEIRYVDLGRATGQESNSGTIARAVASVVKLGLLKKLGRGRYEWTGPASGV